MKIKRINFFFLFLKTHKNLNGGFDYFNLKTLVSCHPNFELTIFYDFLEVIVRLCDKQLDLINDYSVLVYFLILQIRRTFGSKISKFMKKFNETSQFKISQYSLIYS